jgi:SIR2-like domain
MAALKRVFILGAGFSKPAGMPLATGLLPLLIDKLEHDEMREWLDGMRERVAWLSGNDRAPGSFALNIEQVFHYAHFDIEVHRLKQHPAPVGRGDGPCTPWTQAESLHAWLSDLEETLCDVILECDEKSDLASIKRWARIVNERDAVLTFNYDTLVERALAQEGKAWNHGTGRDDDAGITVFKLHGSIDWIVSHRSILHSNCDLLFDKKNANQSDGKSGHVEDDCRLWRCRTPEQLQTWIEGRDLQSLPQGASPRSVGIAGLGAYKELHQIPGLGHVWTKGMRALYQADLAAVVGFSMSDFDAMAQMQFAEVARARTHEGRPMRVIVIDPVSSEAAKDRFRRVFRSVDFVEKCHERFDWSHV